ncbi:hypothetical protein IKF89_00660 [Candidatus Saccharibacteria bacterium]|nr:hypothetical protein [Candidatus Saccharibacteria bacterium]
MKSELFTAIIAAVAGVLISYFVCNLFIGEIEPVAITTIENEVSAELPDPNPEVFNYKALNPTVEIFIGDCTEYDASGACIDGTTNNESTEGEQPSEANQETQ